MNQSRVPVVVLLLVLFLVFAGCSNPLLRDVSRPGVELQSVRLTNLSLRSATMQWDVRVSNPYLVSLPVTQLRYQLLSGEQRLFAGDAGTPGPIPAGESAVIPVPVQVSFSQFRSQLQGVKPGDVVPYTARVQIEVNAPVVGGLSFSRQTRAELPVPAIPRVRFRRVYWERLSLSTAQARMEIELHNPNQFSVGLRAFDYGIRLGGYEVAENKLGRSVTLSANASRTLPLEFRFSPTQFGTGLYHLLQGSESAVSLDGTMTLETRFGSLVVPLEQDGRVPYHHG